LEIKGNIQQINKTKNGFFEKINKINKILAKLTIREQVNAKLIKSEITKEIFQKTPMKFRRSYGNNLKTYASANWKMKNK
jgi:hypothetical protein